MHAARLALALFPLLYAGLIEAECKMREHAYLAHALDSRLQITDVSAPDTRAEIDALVNYRYALIMRYRETTTQRKP